MSLAKKFKCAEEIEMSDQKLERYECWKSSGGDLTFAISGHAELKQAAQAGETHQYTISAATFEEAMAVHHLRQGWEPYQPIGQAAQCQQCRSVYYPDGGGECWKCG